MDVYVGCDAQAEAVARQVTYDLAARGVTIHMHGVFSGDSLTSEMIIQEMAECEWFLWVQAQSTPGNVELQAALAQRAAGSLRGIVTFVATGKDQLQLDGSIVISVTALGYQSAFAQLEQVLNGGTAESPVTQAVMPPTREVSPLPASSWPSAEFHEVSAATPTATPASGVSRRDLLIGAGIVGVGALGIAWALRWHKTTVYSTVIAITPTTPLLAQPRRLITYTGHNAKVFGVAWSPDGMHIASGAAGDVDNDACAVGFDTSIQIWDATTGSHVSRFVGHQCTVRSIAWSAQRNVLASASDDPIVLIWNPSTGKILLRYTGHSAPVRRIRWSPDSTFIASSSNDHTARIWDANTGQTIAICRGHVDNIQGVDWSPDGSMIVTASNDRTARIWNARTGQLISTYTGHSNRVYRAVWSPDGMMIASTSLDGTVDVWQPTTQALVSQFTYHQIGLASDGTPRPLYPLPIAWSPDGVLLAFGGGDDNTTPDPQVDTSVYVWDWRQQQVRLRYEGHPLFVVDLAWSPDGTTLVSGGDDMTAQVWQVR